MKAAVLFWGISLGIGSAWGGVMEVRQAASLLKRQGPVAAEAGLRRLVQTDPQDALGHQVLATAFLLRGRLDSAQVHCTRAIQLDSTLAEAYNNLGMVYTYGRQYDRAISVLAQAIELDAGQPAFYYNAGVACERLERLEEARQAFEAALQIDPWNTEARRHLGSILLWQNKPAEALAQYAAACGFQPQEAANWYGAGKAHARLKQDSLAIVCLERARGLGGTEAEVFYQLGLLYRKQGNTAAADSALERFRQLKKKNPKPGSQVELKMTDPDPARNQYDLGELYARRGWPAAARVRRYRAMGLGLTQKELQPPLPGEVRKPAELERLAGLEAMQHRDYRLAASHYRAAVRLDPHHGLKYRNLGLALHFLERQDEAIQVYQEAIRLDPQLAPAHNDLALLLSRERRQHEEAIQLLHQAVKIDPREKVYRYNLARIYLILWKYPEAVQAFREVLELDPNSALACFSLGWALAQQGRLAEAAGAFEKALQINPNYPEACFELGAAYEGQGLLDKAAAMYSNCLALAPQHKYAHYRLGEVYLKQGRTGEAGQALQRFRELPEHPSPEYVFFVPPDAE